MHVTGRIPFDGAGMNLVDRLFLIADGPLTGGVCCPLLHGPRVANFDEPKKFLVFAKIEATEDEDPGKFAMRRLSLGTSDLLAARTSSTHESLVRDAWTFLVDNDIWFTRRETVELLNAAVRFDSAQCLRFYLTLTQEQVDFLHDGADAKDEVHPNDVMVYHLQLDGSCKQVPIPNGSRGGSGYMKFRTQVTGYEVLEEFGLIFSGRTTDEGELYLSLVFNEEGRLDGTPHNDVWSILLGNIMLDGLHGTALLVPMIQYPDRGLDDDDKDQGDDYKVISILEFNKHLAEVKGWSVPVLDEEHKVLEGRIGDLLEFWKKKAQGSAFTMV